jgi:hypothetical protein
LPHSDRESRWRGEHRASRIRTLDDLIDDWTRRRDEAAAIGALAPTAQLCDLVLRDLQMMRTAAQDELLTLTEAARRSGYSREHLSRLVGLGTIPNAGRRNAPRIRAADLPRKPGHLPDQRVDNDIVGASKAAVVRSIANSQKASLR